MFYVRSRSFAIVAVHQINVVQFIPSFSHLEINSYLEQVSEIEDKYIYIKTDEVHNIG